MANSDEIMRILGRTPFPLHSEKDVQQSVEQAFAAAGVECRREVRLNATDVIDFLVDRVGIEVKIKGGKRAILRQVERYAESDQVDTLVLLTAVAMGMPASIKGKPVHVVSLGRAWL